MPGRNPQEAWRGFRDPIQRVINCVDQSARLIEREFPGGDRKLASPPSGIPFGALNLTFSIVVAPLQEADNDWRMTTKRYTFSVVDQADQMVFQWHWHPYSRRSRIRYPHVHVPSAMSHATKHIPTGRMCLEDIVLFGFDDLGVQPAHESAADVVIEVRDKHKKHRAWH